MSDCGCTSIACDLTVFTPEERAAHFARARRVFEDARVTELDRGFEFSFDRASDEIETWIVGEKRCCPFFDFDLKRSSPAATLRITGPDAAKSILSDAIAQLRKT